MGKGACDVPVDVATDYHGGWFFMNFCVLASLRENFVPSLHRSAV